MVDFKAIRAQFPILDQEIHGHPLVYLDSAATSQKPNAVINAEANFYRTINAGVHRGAHELAARSTMAFEEARAKVAKLVGANAAEGEEEVVVTGGATAGLNLLATAFGNASLGRGGEAAKRFALKPGDEIVVSRAEHHSVLLPFQELSYRTGATFKWIDLTEDGRVRTDNLDEVITERTKVVAVTHVGNATGAITNIAPIIKRAHEVGSIFILDACQSVPHLKVDFHALDVDFAAWSAHKMYGPTGVGFLYGKRDLLEALPPANFGGSMVELAYMDHEAQYMAPPARFEAGTQPVAQVVAAGVAAEWMMNIGLENIEAHEKTIAAELLKLGDVRWHSHPRAARKRGPYRHRGVRRGRRASARCGPVHRRPGHRDSRGTPLRPAGTPPLRPIRIQPCLLRCLQFGRRCPNVGRSGQGHP